MLDIFRIFSLGLSLFLGRVMARFLPDKLNLFGMVETKTTNCYVISHSLCCCLNLIGQKSSFIQLAAFS